MADYYPILARAVSGLSNNNAQARRELYNRARTIVMDQLRQRDPDGLKPQTVQERTALETAIRRVEMEARGAQARAEYGQPQASPAARPPGRATKGATKPGTKGAGRPVAAAVPAKPAASYLARILDALQRSEGVKEAPGQTRTANSDGGVAAAPPNATEEPEKPLIQESGELGGMLQSLATMMLALSYGVAAVAVTAVVYFRGSIMVAAGIIGYPVLLVMTALVIGLFVILPWAFVRKAPSLPAFGFLFRAIHSASRQAS